MPSQQFFPVYAPLPGVISPVRRRRPQVFKAAGTGSVLVNVGLARPICPASRPQIGYAGRANLLRLPSRSVVIPTSQLVRKAIVPTSRYQFATTARANVLPLTKRSIRVVCRPTLIVSQQARGQFGRSTVLHQPYRFVPTVVYPIPKRYIRTAQVINLRAYAGATNVIKRIQVGGTAPVSVFVYSVGTRGASQPTDARASDNITPSREPMRPTGERLH